jgi:hypothetical protein
MNATTLVIRNIEPSDARQWLSMRRELWPGDDGSHASEIKAFFAGTLAEPQAVLIAQVGRTPVGFAELSNVRFWIIGHEIGSGVTRIEWKTK